MIVHVNDIIIIGDDFQEIFELKQWLRAKFEVKNLGTMRYFLGMEVARSKQGLLISQRKYTLDLLKDIGMLGSRPTDARLDRN